MSERLGLHRALTGDDAEQGLLNHIDSRGIGVVSSMGSVRLDEERPFGLGLTAAAATSSKPTCSCASAVLSSGSATADTAGLASSCHLLRGRGPSGVLDGVRWRFLVFGMGYLHGPRPLWLWLWLYTRPLVQSHQSTSLVAHLTRTYTNKVFP